MLIEWGCGLEVDSVFHIFKCLIFFGVKNKNKIHIWIDLSVQRFCGWIVHFQQRMLFSSSSKVVENSYFTFRKSTNGFFSRTANEYFMLKGLLLSTETWSVYKALENTYLRARRWLWRLRPLRFMCPFFLCFSATVSFVFAFSSSSLGTRLTAVSNLEEQNNRKSLASNIVVKSALKSRQSWHVSPLS